MIRLIGALLIVSASVALGIGYVNGEKQRLRALCSMERLLKAVAGEMGTRLTPLPALFSYLENRCDGPAAAFTAVLNVRMEQLGEKEFSIIWSESIDAVFGALSKEERELLRAPGYNLGRYELERQLTELNLTLDLLAAAIAGHNAALPEKRRLGLGLSWACGALLIVVLL